MHRRRERTHNKGIRQLDGCPPTWGSRHNGLEKGVKTRQVEERAIFNFSFPRDSRHLINFILTTGGRDSQTRVSHQHTCVVQYLKYLPRRVIPLTSSAGNFTCCCLPGHVYYIPGWRTSCAAYEAGSKTAQPQFLQFLHMNNVQITPAMLTLKGSWCHFAMSR